MGKSYEIQYLASYLYDKGLFPTVIFLRDYCGGKIEDCIPQEYQVIPDKYLTLLFDGYDELSNHLQSEFTKQLRTYMPIHTESAILITARSNYCRTESDDKSNTFDGLRIYDLCGLNTDSIKQYLQAHQIDVNAFYKCTGTLNVQQLLRNPFYLTAICELYQKNRELPQKSKLMEDLIKMRFCEDDNKQDGGLEDRQRDLLTLLEKIAFAMKLMQTTYFEDSQKYQELFTLKERKLAKASGLLLKSVDKWAFSHNNFLEYLAAKYLSKLPQEQAVLFFAGRGAGIKKSWVNVLGYFTGLVEWDLVTWLSNHTPNALVKFEPDRTPLSDEDKLNIFKRIFEEYEADFLTINDELFDDDELARFADSDELIDYLIDKIRNPIHNNSQYSAVLILRHVKLLPWREDEVQDCLMDCCRGIVPTSDHIIRVILFALIDHKLYSDKITAELMSLFSKSESNYIRAGLYDYLTAVNQQDKYVSFFLDGIPLIIKRNKFLNEFYSLHTGLKSLSSIGSISQAIQAIFEERSTSYRDKVNLISQWCKTAQEQYLNGHDEFFDIMLQGYLGAEEKARPLEKTFTTFFVNTNTVKRAIDTLIATTKNENEIIHFVRAVPDAMCYVVEAYQNGCFTDCTIFYSLIQFCVEEQSTYNAYQNMIVNRDGYLLPDWKAPIDYEAIRIKGNADYFEALFEYDNMKNVFDRLYKTVGNVELAATECMHWCEEIEFESAEYKLLSKLTCIMEHHPKQTILDCWHSLEWKNFSIHQICEILCNNSEYKLTAPQKTYIESFVANWIDQDILKNAISYNNGCIRCNIYATYIAKLAVTYDIFLSEDAILDLTELPAFCFSDDSGEIKYKYLESKLSPDKLRKRIEQNIKSGVVQDDVLLDHIGYCTRERMNCAYQQATKLCLDPESYNRYTALDYLNQIYGDTYIRKNIIPTCDEQMIIDIRQKCPKLQIPYVKDRMEALFQESHSQRLLSELIVLESAVAIEYYISEVKRRNAVIDMQETSSSPTESIRTIHNPTFIPQLGELVEVLFQPNFKDKDFRTLWNSLMEAFVACAKSEPQQAIAEIEKHRPSAGKNESNIRFCTYTIRRIKEDLCNLEDTPKNSKEVKAMLKEFEVYK